MQITDFGHRRQLVFLALSGIFLASIALANIIGASVMLRFFSFELFGNEMAFVVAVATLVYPMTFLVTDLVTDIYGRKRATDLVLIGLLVNFWVFFFVWLGGALPGAGEIIDPATGLPPLDAAGRLPLYYEIQDQVMGTVTASVLAYLIAQLLDVNLYHWIKNKTSGRYLWLRNNVSTMLSQLIDTVIFVSVLYWLVDSIKMDEPVTTMTVVEVIFSTYVFKFLVALVDTLPLYGLNWFFRRYLGVRAGYEVSKDNWMRTTEVAQAES